jgi:hypothetical protein
VSPPAAFRSQYWSSAVFHAFGVVQSIVNFVSKQLQPPEDGLLIMIDFHAIAERVYWLFVVAKLTLLEFVSMTLARFLLNHESHSSV